MRAPLLCVNFMKQLNTKSFGGTDEIENCQEAFEISILNTPGMFYLSFRDRKIVTFATWIGTRDTEGFKGLLRK